MGIETPVREQFVQGTVNTRATVADATTDKY